MTLQNKIANAQELALTIEGFAERTVSCYWYVNQKHTVQEHEMHLLYIDRSMQLCFI
jgi:hypothetical protein